VLKSVVEAKEVKNNFDKSETLPRDILLLMIEIYTQPTLSGTFIFCYHINSTWRAETLFEQ
jgi:hypothetical protein